MRLRLFEIHGHSSYTDIKKGNSYCPKDRLLKPHLFQANWPPEGHAGRMTCTGCGTEFLTQTLTSKEVLRNLIVESINNIPGRDLGTFVTQFKASLPEDEVEELDNVLPFVEEEIDRLIDEQKIAAVFCSLKHYNVKDTKLLFPADTIFGIVSPKLTFQMSGK